MTSFFCDELSERCVLALREAGVQSVVVLDEPDAAGRALAQRHHLAFAEARFFAGHLRDEHGEAVYFVARRTAGRLALAAAKQVVAGSTVLARIADRFEGATLRLAIAKFMAMEIETKLMRALVAKALSGGEDSVLWLRAPQSVPAEVFGAAVPGVQIRFVAVHGARARPIVKSLLVEFARYLRGLASPARNRPGARPAVLVTREDDLGLDRSYRSQPHWVDPAQPLGFNVYVRGRGRPLTAAVAAQLAAAGIHCLTHGDAAAALRRHRALPALRQLASEANACLLAALCTHDAVLLRILLHARLLLLRGRELGAQARNLGVRAFVSGEPYLVESDAMQLAAPALKVATITFQYSNLAFLSPLMLTTSDRMALFSQTYRPIWDADGIHPLHWEYLGYSMDGAAQHVRERAAQLRARLQGSGARFVLCYFD
ncbi:MAG: hypothetical protein ABIT36_09780, partial [Steroidobacteraceae bacterium]